MKLTSLRSSSENKQESPSLTRIQKWFQKLDTNWHDIIFVYYTGLGQADPQSRQLYFNLNGRKVYRKEIVKSIEESKARLKILITDTDSSGPSVTDATSISKFDIPGSSLSRTDTFRHLFLEHQGFLNLTAATEGEFALGDSRMGSYFTNVLVKIISDFRDLNGDNFASWEEVFKITRQRTMDIFDQSAVSVFLARDMKMRGVKSQRPKYYGELPRRF